MYLELFEQHPTGRLVLEDLVSRFSGGLVTRGGIDAILRTYENGGNRQVVDYIVTQINRGNGVPDTQGEDDGNRDD